MSILIMPISGMKERRVDVQPEEKELEVSFAKKIKKMLQNFSNELFLKSNGFHFKFSFLSNIQHLQYNTKVSQ